MGGARAGGARGQAVGGGCVVVLLRGEEGARGGGGEREARGETAARRRVFVGSLLFCFSPSASKTHQRSGAAGPRRAAAWWAALSLSRLDGGRDRGRAGAEGFRLCVCVSLSVC